MKSHITVQGTKYRVVKAFRTFEESEVDHDLSVCEGCVFEALGECRTRFRAKDTLKCVEGDDEAMRDAERTDYILIDNTREALADYVAHRLEQAS
jgi:hypothetical protein